MAIGIRSSWSASAIDSTFSFDVEAVLLVLELLQLFVVLVLSNTPTHNYFIAARVSGPKYPLAGVMLFAF